MNRTIRDREGAWRGRRPMAEVMLLGDQAKGVLALYDTPVGMLVSVRIGGRGLHEGSVYRLGREVGGKREIFSWFPPLYEREGEASRQIMTQKISPKELWDCCFFLRDQEGVELMGRLERQQPLGRRARVVGGA